MSVQIKKDITTVQVEVPKTNVAIETAVTEITVQTSTPQITISDVGLTGKSGVDGTSGTSGIDGAAIDTGSFATTGSNLFRGDETISGSLFISGATELGGNIVPKTARGATLGTEERPFSDIFVSSGSINIASDIIGDPNTTLSNIGGNILVSAGGMRLVGDASFIAATGSFNYISGSLTQVGNYERFGNTILIGDQITTGSLLVSGSTIMVGDNTMTGNTSLTGSVNISGSTTIVGTTNFSDSSTTVTGSFLISGSTTQIGNNTLIGNTILSGSVKVSASMNVDGTFTASLSEGYFWVGGSGNISKLVATSSFAKVGSNTFSGSQIITGSLLITGSSTTIGNTILSGSLTLSSGSALNINNGFYVDGNRQFNYGQFSDLTTQSGSADTAYAMKLNTTDLAVGFSVVDGTKITATNTGIYNLQFSAQLLQTTNGASDISIWLRKNGTNITNSNTDLTIEKVAGGGKLVAAWNYVVQLNANQYVELMWSSNSSNTQIHYISTQSTPTRPATPSVIATITQIA